MTDSPAIDQPPSIAVDSPRCPECKDPMVRATLQTTASIYYRCDICGHLWVSRRPLTSEA
jgi:hypothetical protein